MGFDGPIILAGCMGSGSTLLRLMLDSHEDVAIPQETGFLRIALAYKHVPFWAFGGDWYERLEMGEDEMLHHVGDSFDRLFRRYAERHGAKRWGEKTPFNTWLLPLAAELFPNAAIVGIVRHPGAVMASLRHRFGHTWPKAALYWTRETTQLVHHSMELGDRITLLRYEDLCLQQEQVLRGLLTRLELPWSEAVLTHHEVQAQRSATVLAEGNTRVDQPVDLRRISRWVDSFDEDAWAELKDRPAPLAEFLGYRVDDATAPVPWNTGEELLTGTGLRQRREANPGAVDWTWHPPPHVGNHVIRTMPRRQRVSRREMVAWRDAAPPLEMPLPTGLRAVYQRLPEGLRQRSYRARRRVARALMGRKRAK